MKHYDYLIVGAGLFGATFAERQSALGKKCLVIEKRDHIAGNVYTEECEGIEVHKYGCHIMHTDDVGVWEYLSRFTRFNHFRNEPVANYKGELYNLPFNMNTFHQMWGVNTPAEAKEIIDKQRGEITGEPKNLEEQAISLVGRDIYEKLIKGYTEKQWGRDCKDLPAFIIRRLPVRMRFDNNYFNHSFQGIPEDGYTNMVARMLDKIKVQLNEDYLADREKWNACADTVVYTGPIDAFYDYSEGRLEYRSLRFETEVLDMENYQGIAAMNFTDRETPYTRIIEHKHFAFGTQEKTIITREYSAEFKEGMEPYYPINDEKNAAIYARYKQKADAEENVIFGGRLAEYKYYDMDQVVRSALNAVAE